MNRKPVYVYITVIAIITITVLSTIMRSINMQQNYLVLTLNVYLSGGEVIAPHLYDWMLRQELSDQGIDIPTSVVVPSTLTVLSGVTTTYIGSPPPYAGWLFQHLGSGTWGGFVSVTVEQGGGAVYRLTAPDNSEVSLDVPNVYRVGEVVDVCVRYDGSVMEFLSNGNLVRIRYYTGGVKSGSGALRIGGRTGSPSFTTFVSYLVYYSKVTSPVTKIFRLLYFDGMIVFLDPTFFDGFKYVDLSGNGNHGYPFGGVARVPANQTWLWLVRGMYNDSKIRFRFVPRGWYIAVINMDTLWSTVIDTSVFSANPAGLVELIEVPIPSAGNYRIVVAEDPIYITLTTTTVVTATVTYTTTTTIPASTVYVTDTVTSTATALWFVPATTVTLFATTTSTYTYTVAKPDEPGFHEGALVYILMALCLVLPAVMVVRRSAELGVFGVATSLVMVLLYVSTPSPPPLWRIAISIALFSNMLNMVISIWIMFRRSGISSLVAATITGIINFVSAGIATAVEALPIEVGALIAVATALILTINLVIAGLRKLHRPLRRIMYIE